MRKTKEIIGCCTKQDGLYYMDYISMGKVNLVSNKK
uniref:Uncharacterized protein n=1 Tax=Manihot esculenta TaxID=3983 RepID=A0A2C9W0C3_MANES